MPGLKEKLGEIQMGKIFNLDSPLMQLLSKMADLMLLNIITLLLFIPVITGGAALTALNYMTLKIAKGEEGYIIKGYFKSFKENFRQATVIWLIVVVMAAVLIGDFVILSSIEVTFGTVMKVLLTIVTIVCSMTLAYVFPVLSRFENTIKNTIKNSFLMSIMNLPRTVLLLIFIALPMVLVLLSVQAIPLLFMFGFSLPAYLCSLQFVKIFKKYEPEEEETASSDELETLSFIREEMEEKQRQLEAEQAAAAESESKEEESGE